jgi:hypothetical protein
MNKKKAPRIPKAPQRRLKDLKNLARNLNNAIKRHEENDEAAYLDILQNTRTLVGRGDGNQIGVIHSICKATGVTLTLHSEGKGTLTFDEFLEDSMLTLDARRISNGDFIWEYGSQEASHSDDKLDPEYVTGESVWVGGHGQVTSATAYIIGKAVLISARQLQKALGEKP